MLSQTLSFYEKILEKVQGNSPCRYAHPVTPSIHFKILEILFST